MSLDKKNIDNLFKDKLQNFEAIPSASSWNKIAAALPQKKKKNKPVVFWLFTGGMAASLLLFMTLQFLNSSESLTKETIQIVSVEELCPEDDFKQKVDELITPPNKSIVLTDSKKQEETTFEITEINESSNNKQGRSKIKVNSTQQNQNSTYSKNSIVSSENKSRVKKEMNSMSNIAHGNMSIIPKNKENSYSFISKSPKEKQEKMAIENKLSEQELIAELQGNDPSTEVETKSRKKWSIQPQVAPIVYNSFSEGSTISNTFSDNEQSSKTNLSYGLRIAYQISNKISIRTGISTASINLTTNDIAISSTNDNGNAIAFDSSNEIVGLTDFAPPTASITNDASPQITDALPENIRSATESQNGSLQQNFSYIEIPLELTYRLLDKRIGLNMIGGISTFILNEKQNEIFFKTETKNTLVGEAKNLNKTSYSGNFGLGVDYKLSQNLKFNIEPLIKFQFNAFDKETNYKPYLFGIYSGLQLNF